MTFSAITQILTAERDLRPAHSTLDPRFASTDRSTVRGLGARAIRAAAGLGLRMADLLDPGYRYA